MLHDKIKEAYAKVQGDRRNAADWLALAKEDMKPVEALCKAQKTIDPSFDKKAYLASLDEIPAENPSDPDAYLNREVSGEPYPGTTPDNFPY